MDIVAGLDKGGARVTTDNFSIRGKTYRDWGKIAVKS
jgi:hypothetical protein